MTDLTDLLEWPAETWTGEERQLVAQHKAHLHTEMRTLVDRCERFDRGFTADEQAEYDRLQAEYERIRL